MKLHRDVFNKKMHGENMKLHRDVFNEKKYPVTFVLLFTSKRRCKIFLPMYKEPS